jgi:hypothetical protein
MFYTYLWLRGDGTPYYVGKGSGKRAFTSGAHGVHRPKDTGRIILQEHSSEEDAFCAEIFLIAYYGRKDTGVGCLRNRTDGGEGLSLDASIKGGRIAGRRCVENGHMDDMRSRLTSDILSEAGKLGMSRMTVAQHSEYGKRGHAHGLALATKEQRSEWARQSGLKAAQSGRIQKLAAKGGKIGNHNRWHVSRSVISPNCSLCMRRLHESGRKIPGHTTGS